MTLDLGFGYVSKAHAGVHFLSSTDDDFGLANDTYDSASGVVCVPPEVGVGMSWKNAGGQTVYSSCTCPANYQYTQQNCAYPNVLDGAACQGKYDTCTCTATYNSSNCPSPKELGGDTCGDKYMTCTCPDKYDQTCTDTGQVGHGTPCNVKYTSCDCSSSYQTCSNGPAADASSCLNTTTGQTMYTSCACPSGYTEDPCPAGQSIDQTYPDKPSCHTCKSGCGPEYTQAACGTNQVVDTVCPYDSSYHTCRTLTCQEVVTKNQGAGVAVQVGDCSSSGYPSTCNPIGPKCYPYTECQALATPTITSTNLPWSYICGIKLILNSNASGGFTSNLTIENSTLNIGNSTPSTNAGALFTGYTGSSLNIKGDVSISTTGDFSEYTSKTGTAAKTTIFSGARASLIATAPVAGMSGNGLLGLYNDILEVQSNAVATISAVKTYNGRATYDGKASDRIVLVSGALYIKTVYFINGAVTINSTGTFRSDQWWANINTSGDYRGIITWQAGSQIQLGSTCRKMSKAGSYKFQVITTTLPSAITASTASTACDRTISWP